MMVLLTKEQLQLPAERAEQWAWSMMIGMLPSHLVKKLLLRGGILIERGCWLLARVQS